MDARLLTALILGLILSLSLVLAVAGAKSGDGTKPRSYCGELSEIVAAITRPAWGEAHRFDLVWQGAPARIYVNEKTGTWTFMVLPGRTRACLIGVGRGWRPAAPRIEGSPA